MHKIYTNFLEGKSKLIDMFLDDPELHKKLKVLFLIISRNHAYFAKPSTTDTEKKAAAQNAASFTIRNGCQKLLSMFMEYENSLYQNK